MLPGHDEVRGQVVCQHIVRLVPDVVICFFRLEGQNGGGQATFEKLFQYLRIHIVPPARCDERVFEPG